MTLIISLMLIASWIQPPSDYSTAVCDGSLEPTGKRGKRKLPEKKEEKPERPVNLNRCLDSCAAGGAVFIRFCNDIESPVTRAVCFSKSNESEKQCRGFCYNYFGR